MSLSSQAGAVRARPLRGSGSLGPVITTGSSHLWPAGIGCSFAGYRKQTGSKWLNICLFWIYLKQLDLEEFEFRFELTLLVYCKEVNDIRAHIRGPVLDHLYNNLRKICILFGGMFYK